MDKLYKIEDINFLNSKMEIKKVEFVYEMETSEYNFIDSEFCKHFICINGSCELHLSKNNTEEIITLNDLKNKICVEKGIETSLKNCSGNLKIVIEYLKELNKEG